jgi:hypothetical protein
MIIRDFYFAAWAIEQGFSYTFKNGCVCLGVDASTLNRLKQEYETTCKPKFERIRLLVKTLNDLRLKNGANSI